MSSQQLSQIINEAVQNKALDLSRDAKTYLGLFKEQGDLSAHNPFHTAFKKDLELLQPRFRHLIQELLHKSGVLKQQVLFLLHQSHYQNHRGFNLALENKGV